MAVLIDVATERLSRSANLPTNTAFTLAFWAQVVADRGTGILQPLFWGLDAGNTDGPYLTWEGNGVDATAYLGCLDGGTVSAETTFASRPAVNEAAFWYVRCSGTGAGLLQGGWRGVGSNSFVTAATTMGAGVAAMANWNLGSLLDTYFSQAKFWNVKAWNRALTDSELLIESYFAKPQFPSSINFWWPLPNASDTADRSGNGRNATVVGTPTTGDQIASLWRHRQKLFLPQSAPPASYDLEVTPGSYALTGSSARLERDLLIRTTAGSYSVTGSSARLNLTRYLGVTPGSYSLTGSAARTERDALVNVTPGSYSLTGSSARLESDRRLEVSPGSYALTGSSAELIYTQPAGAFELLVTPGAYSITGSNAGLEADRLLIASPGSYSLTVSSARLDVVRLLRTTAGSYALTGSSARLEADRVIRTTAGSYAITGFSAELDYQSLNKELITTAGTYSITGFPAELIGPNRRQGGGSPRRKGYIVKGVKYWLTDDELARLLAQMLTEVKRTEVRRDTKKPKVLSHGTWARLQESMKVLEAISTPEPEDFDEDDEEALLLLL